MGYTQQRTLAHQQVHLELPSQQTNCYVCRVPSQCPDVHADWKLRNIKDNSKWKVDILLFQEIATHLGQQSEHNFLDTLHGNQTQAA